MKRVMRWHDFGSEREASRSPYREYEQGERQGGAVTRSYALKTMPGKTRTQVLVWMVDIPNGVTRNIQVTVDGQVSCSATDGQVLFISGPWSVGVRQRIEVRL